jgi:FkbM family methyltransferase
MLVERRVRDFTMVLDTDDCGMSQPLLRGAGWEGAGPDILESILLLKPGMTVIDMGACIGFYSLLCATVSAHVYAVEADPDNCAIIRKAAEANAFDNLLVYNLAIAGLDGTARFQPSPGRSDRGRLSDKGPLEVETVTLDTFVEREGIGPVDVLRCDIEGAEVGMVAGGQKTLAVMREGSWIYVDLHPQKMNNPFDLMSTIENIIEHGFIPETLVGSKAGLNPSGFAESICSKGGFPKVFFQKAT